MFAQYTAAVSRLGEGEAGWQAQAAPQLPRTQREVRSRVNATAAPTTGRALHEGFFANAAANPQAPALLWGAHETLSYGELARRALSVAGALEAAGVGPGDAVAIQLPKGPDQVTAALGVLSAGAVYVPIGFDQPAARRERILVTADAVAAIGADDRQFDGTGPADTGDRCGAGASAGRRADRPRPGIGCATCCSPPDPPARPRASRFRTGPR